MAKRSLELSVLMSVYNGKNLVRRTIESVLSQSYRDFEFLIISDGSTDGSYELLKKYEKSDKRVKVFKNSRNLGLTKSLITLVNKSKGKYIARIDCGSLCKKYRFKRQLSFLSENPSYGLVGSNVNIINKFGKVIGEIRYPLSNNEIQKSLLSENMFTHSAIMFTRQALKTVGQYRAEFYYAQDYDLILRISEHFKVANLEEKLTSWYLNIQGSTISRRRYQNKYAQKARLDAIRRRNLSPLNKAVIKHYITDFIVDLIPLQIKLSLLRGRTINLSDKKFTLYK